MLRDYRKNKVFNRRAMILGTMQSSIVAALVLRLGYLQLLQYDEYSTQSDSNRIKPLINPSPRGTVFDRNGTPLTRNNHNYRLLLYMESKSNVEQIIKRLVEVLGLSAEENQILLKRVSNSKRRSIVSLMDNLSWDDLCRIEVNYHKLSGVSIESGIMRGYPYPNETAHFLGYVSLPSEKEIANNEQALFMHPDFRIGKSGIEKSFDELLRGKFGVKYVEVNAFNMPIRTLYTKSGSEGTKLNLTIDLGLQKFSTERVKDNVASVVVMDVKTGEIVSYVSSPSFDPNRFVEGISREYWNQLLDDPNRPLNNKPITATYPPGSTFKLMVALAGLEAKVSPRNQVLCNGYYRFGKKIFHCWKEEGHGRMDMVNAIKNSCNTYFFDLANMVGIERITEVAKRFGYSEYLDISLYGAKTGNLPSDEWKRKVLNQPWVGGDTINAAIGQGFVLATPLQMALVTARIANGGVPIKPYLVKNKNLYEQYDLLKNKKLVNKNYLDLVLSGMNKVVNEPGGTAYAKRITVSGFEMAGKTGTSQVISKREKEMSSEEKQNNQNHAIFVGFAPVNDPRYAISVVVEHGGAGSAAAAPIGRDILLEAQRIVKRFDS